MCVHRIVFVGGYISLQRAACLSIILSENSAQGYSISPVSLESAIINTPVVISVFASVREGSNSRNRKGGGGESESDDPLNYKSTNY